MGASFADTRQRLPVRISKETVPENYRPDGRTPPLDGAGFRGLVLLALALLGEGAARGGLGSGAGASVPQNLAGGRCCFAAGLLAVSHFDFHLQARTQTFSGQTRRVLFCTNAPVPVGCLYILPDNQGLSRALASSYRAQLGLLLVL